MDRNSPGTDLCERCTQRPHGLEGHDNLVRPEALVNDGPPGVTPFQCGLCRAVWGRGYMGGGQFEWVFKPNAGNVEHTP